VNSTAEQWNDRYGQSDYFYGTEPNDFLSMTAHRMPMGAVMCLADGEGRNSTFLASLGYEVSSVDISPVGIQKTLELARRKHVEVNAEVGDLESFDLGVNKWQGIVSIFCHLPSELRRDVHRRVVAALAPGGVVILEAYTPNQIGRGTGGPQSADLLMTTESLQEEFSHLEILHLQEVDREVIEGTGHSGTASVVQLVARKN
jgi:2-polyprenyl-3-methyl-5-hydroxy-6-metoxy-1,4-benzoquinol methylase